MRKKSSELGMTMIETLLATVLLVVTTAAVFAIVQSMQKSHLQTQRRLAFDELFYRIREVAQNRAALLQTMDHDPRFRTCFQVGPFTDPAVACNGGVTYGLNIYDTDGSPVAGTASSPVYFDSSGKLCTDQSPGTQCPFAVTATYQAQGYPQEICDDCVNVLPYVTPPAGIHHELVMLTYNVANLAGGETMNWPDAHGFVIVSLESWNL